MPVPFFLQFLYSQWFVTPPEQPQKFTGQTVIVTGSTGGLGYEAAKQIVQQDAAKVILAVRDVERGAKAKKDIELATGAKESIIEVWQLDLASYDSVKAFAKKAGGLERLDVLLENAGMQYGSGFRTAEGSEMTITTNVISTFLLALLLLPKLKESATKFNIKPHLVIVASEVHYFTTLPERNDPSGSIFETLNDPDKARIFDRYNVSKLLEVFAVRQIAQDHIPAGSPVIINCMNPGLVHTNLMQESGYMGHVIKYALGARTVEVGARTLVNAASFGKESHGQYLSNCQVDEVSSFVRSEDGIKTQKRVWDELLAILEGISPGISKNLKL